MHRYWKAAGLILLSSCTYYQSPQMVGADGAVAYERFIALGGEGSWTVLPDGSKSIVWRNEKSFKDVTRLAGIFANYWGMGLLAREQTAQQAISAGVDKEALKAGVEEAGIRAGVEKAAINAEVAKLELMQP